VNGVRPHDNHPAKARAAFNDRTLFDHSACHCTLDKSVLMRPWNHPQRPVLSTARVEVNANDHELVKQRSRRRAMVFPILD